MPVNIQFSESSSNLSWASCLSETKIQGSSNLIPYNYQRKIHFRRKISVERNHFSLWFAKNENANIWYFMWKLLFLSSQDETKLVLITNNGPGKLIRIPKTFFYLFFVVTNKAELWISKTVTRILDQFDSQNFGCRTSQILTKFCWIPAQ